MMNQTFQQVFIVITLWTVCTLLLQSERLLANAAFSSSSSTPSMRILTIDGSRRQGQVIYTSSIAALRLFNSHLSTCSTRTSKSKLFHSRDWIDEVNYMDDDKNTNVDEKNAIPVAPDMKYLPRNVLRQNQNFVAIRQAGGKELTNDVYIRQPTATTARGSKDDDDDDDDMDECTFWYVGKIARVTDVTPQQAIQRQWNLIETHASQLRPLELYPARGSLEIFLAPGDSELQVAYHRPDVKMEKVDRIVNEQDHKALLKLKSTLMGFQGEIYNGGEEGFRTLRYRDGSPSRKEISATSSTSSQDDELQTPTDDEMAEIQSKLQGQDLNSLYEEQQRRAGKPIID